LANLEPASIPAKAGDRIDRAVGSWVVTALEARPNDVKVIIEFA
jgi:hypothetical protein